MPSKRFSKLDTAKQRQILEVAGLEFSTHGYDAASYNQIIAGAGVSKGAMYYYFEDKADLYATVLRDCVTRFLVFLGPLPEVESATGFWMAVEEMYVRGMRFYEIDRTAIGLTRSLAGAVVHGDTAAPIAELREVTEAWMAGLVATGQRLGAVRTDVPTDLLLAVAVSVSDGIDLWLARHIDEMALDDLEAFSKQFVDLYRRMAKPTVPR